MALLCHTVGIFDRAEGRRWEDKLFHRHESAAGYAIDVWGM